MAWSLHHSDHSFLLGKSPRRIKWGKRLLCHTYKLAWLWPESLLLFIHFYEQSQDVVQNCRKSVLLMCYEVGPDKFWLTETGHLDSVKGKCPGSQLLIQWAITNAPQLTLCSEHRLHSQEPKAKNELRKITQWDAHSTTQRYQAFCPGCSRKSSEIGAWGDFELLTLFCTSVFSPAKWEK